MNIRDIVNPKKGWQRPFIEIRPEVIFECTNDDCRWRGTTAQKIELPSTTFDNMMDLSCPKCQNNEFYRVNLSKNAIDNTLNMTNEK